MTADQLAKTLQTANPDEIREALESIGYEVLEEEDEKENARKYAQYRATVDPKLKELGVPAPLVDLAADIALGFPGIETPEGLQPDLRAAIASVNQDVRGMTNRAQRRHLAHRRQRRGR